ncbi:MAG: S4 domain-containing protein, partial [Candidatus Puniceispirillaceae bacterium]
MIKPPKKAEKPFSLVQTDVPERIAKRIARAGICSRREAEVLVLAGRVKLNGKILDTAACNVTAKDRIDVDDKRIPTAEPARLWRYYKSRGLVVSNRDEKGRDTIFDRL